MTQTMPVTIRLARPADAEAIARVHVASWRSTYPGIVPATYLESLSCADMAAFCQRRLALPPEQSFIMVAETVAEDGAGQIVGFAAGGPERGADANFSGELYAIYLLAEVQRQGIGRRLAGAVARELARQGATTMLVWVLAANSSRRFYEALGGRPVCQREILIGGVPLPEQAYGWHDMSDLLMG